MKFKLSYSFPVIIVVFALVSVFFLSEIEPFNYVIAAIVLVIAGVMAWRIYYDFSSSLPKKQETGYVPSSKVSSLIKESPKESKMKLDDFLKSSPKDFESEKDFESDFEKEFSFDSGKKDSPDPFSDDSFGDLKYREMKNKALDELKNVLKKDPSKKKKDEKNDS
ncbi:MAG: hypothetical protein ABH986_03360 [archaeon]